MSKEYRPVGTGRLLRALRLGANQDALLKIADSNTTLNMPEKEGYQKGVASETASHNAVLRLPFIPSIHINPRGSEGDRNMVDFIVNLTPEPALKTVDVQVKSSEERIQDAFKEITNRYNVKPADITTWLLANRLIFLNGQMEPKLIQEDFINQLRKIRRHQESLQGLPTVPHEVYEDVTVDYVRQVKKKVALGELKNAAFKYRHDTCTIVVRLLDGSSKEFTAKKIDSFSAAASASKELIEFLDNTPTT